MMIINDELIEQWEPQVHKIARTMSIIGMDYDDIVQELRMGVMKAAKGYKEESGVIFHTYLYKTLMNTASTLITRASKKHKAMPTVPMPDGFDQKDGEGEAKDLEILDTLDNLDLSCMEREFIQLRMEGFSMKELGEKLGVKGVYRLNKQIKQKVKDQLGKKREADIRL
jgi:RNA polymerase sigma factor (sigma-70 family)